MKAKVFDKTKPFPIFLIVGALKSGTNSLFQYLKYHPQIFMCHRNESSFFAYEGNSDANTQWGRHHVIRNFDEYQTLFEGAKGKLAIGEMSPMYLVCDQAPTRIKHYIPDAKLIAALCHPVDRAYSQWQMELCNGTETLEDFSKTIQVKQTMSNGSIRQRYVYGGQYYSLLKRYCELFDSTQVCILLFDQLQQEPKKVLQQIYQFLHVDTSYLPPNLSERHNEGGIFRNKQWNFFYQNLYPTLANFKNSLPTPLLHQSKRVSKFLKKQILTRPTDLSEEMRSQLMKVFRDEILLLQDLIEQDLSLWL